MSELIQKNNDCATIRWKLLTSASALALTAYISSDGLARAEDASRPQVWIELGGQFEQMSETWERFAPPFVANINTSTLVSPEKIQTPPSSALSADGKISFHPKDSDWVFSAAVRVGRSSSRRKDYAQTNPGSAIQIVDIPAIHKYRTQYIAPDARQFVNASAYQEEHHSIIDFQVGKDVGLGAFGGRGSSVISVGLRYAQFTSLSRVTIGADPDFHFSYSYITKIPPPFPPFSAYIKNVHQEWHDYAANESNSRSFHGIGPSLSWEASAAFAGHPEAAELMVDWGINAALLFGRQRVREQQDTQVVARTGFFFYQQSTPYPHRYHNIDRSKSVLVPNIGGFAGLSFRYPNAKISIGYRADLFFGAEDGGIDTRKTYNRNFYGPFATVSIGLGG